MIEKVRKGLIVLFDGNYFNLQLAVVTYEVCQIS